MSQAFPDRHAAAVLISGGLDSCVLAAELCATYRSVQPLYVRSGLAWEEVEQKSAAAFLDALAHPAALPLRILDFPMHDLYRSHWSINGEGVPAADSDDSAVYIPGRNIALIGKAAILCALEGIPVLALGPLSGNPFPDARQSFFDRMAEAVSLGLDHRLEIIAPLLGLEKKDVIRRGASFPLGLTFSCMAPRGDLHCGRCNKCGERRSAFVEAGARDPTVYASPR